MNRRRLIKEIREKYGDPKGDELKELVIRHFNPPWGARFIAHDKISSGQEIDNPRLESLTPLVLRELAK